MATDPLQLELQDLQELHLVLQAELSLPKAIPSFYQASCFGMVGNMVRQVNSMSLDPLLHFICCEVSFLIRSITVWNTMIVDKAIDGSFGRSIVCREGKSISRVAVCFNKSNVLPLP